MRDQEVSKHFTCAPGGIFFSMVK